MEKVIKGIECCEIKGDCTGCPYDVEQGLPACKQLAIDALALLKEQEAAYLGAEELLRQKTILFDDAIKRLKEQDERIKMLEHQLETITKWRANAGAFD